MPRRVSFLHARRLLDLKPGYQRAQRVGMNGQSLQGPIGIGDGQSRIIQGREHQVRHGSSGSVPKSAWAMAFLSAQAASM